MGGLSPQEVLDLFAYVRALRTGRLWPSLDVLSAYRALMVAFDPGAISATHFDAYPVLCQNSALLK